MDNVTIFGVPRSGTSWLGQIFNSSPNVVYRYQPIFAYSFEDTLSVNSTAKDIQKFHENLLLTDDDFVCQKKNTSGNKAPEFNKNEISHLVWKEVRYLNIIETLIQQSSVKVIAIVRHPCGVIKSWMRAPKEFNEEWSIEQEWQYAEKKNSGNHEFYGYERWVEATQMFMDFEKKHPNRFKTITYESLLQNVENKVNSLFSFVGLKVTEQTQHFLEKSTNRTSDDPYGVYRKNKSGYEWKKKLSPHIIKQILNDKRFVKIARYYDWKF